MKQSLPTSSLPSSEAVNLEKYWEVIRQLDPELYKLKILLREFRVNPVILESVIKSISNLAYGSGYGKIQIFMQNKRITNVKPEESNEVNEDALLEVDNIG